MSLVLVYEKPGASAGAGALNSEIIVESTGAGAQTDMPFRTMLAIAPGELPAGHRLVVKDGATPLAVGEDNEVTDINSARRLIGVTGLVDLTAGQKKTLTVTSEVGSPNSGTPITAADILDTDFEIDVTVTIGADVYLAAARDGLNGSGTWGLTTDVNHGKFYNNPYCTCFIVSVPLRDTGVADSHLRAFFHIYAYKTGSGAYNSSTNPIVAIETDVVIENGYLFESGPRGVTYDYKVELTDGSKTTVVTRTAFDHWYAGRYRETGLGGKIWWGTQSEYWATQEWTSLRASKYYANFEVEAADVGTPSTTILDNDPIPMTIVGSEARGIAKGFSSMNPEPTICGMPPQVEGWASETEEGYRWLIEQSEVMGWVDWHWRDEATGKLIDPANYAAYTTTTGWPQMREGGGGGGTDVVASGSGPAAPWNTDMAHDPGPSYPAYLASGDFFHFEEMCFDVQRLWGDGNVNFMKWSSSTKGNGYDRVLHGDMDGVNGDAWQQRSIAWWVNQMAECAACIPDSGDGIVLPMAQTIPRTILANQMKKLWDENADSMTAANFAAYAGDLYYEGGAKTVFNAAANNEIGGGTGGYGWSNYQEGYLTQALHHAREMAVLDTNGESYQEWFHVQWTDLGAKTGMGKAKDRFCGIPYWASYTVDRPGAGEHYRTYDWEQIYYDNFRNLRDTSQNEPRGAGFGNVGCTLSATSGSAITCTFDSAVFLGDTTWYEGLYIFEGSGAPPGPGAIGRAEIVSVSTTAICVIDTTYTHWNTAIGIGAGVGSGYDGSAFTTTGLTAGNVFFPHEAYGYGTEATETEVLARYLAISLSCMRMGSDWSLRDAAGALTYADTYHGNYDFSSNEYWGWRILER